MGIQMMDDVVAPAAVTAVDILTLEVAPEWNEMAAYVIAAGGYVGGFMNIGGRQATFVKNLGIASFDWAGRSLYKRIRGGGVTRRMNRSATFTPAPVSRSSVQRSYQPEFESVTPHAF